MCIEIVYCQECIKKIGSFLLCKSCLANRNIISGLEDLLDKTEKINMQLKLDKAKLKNMVGEIIKMK